jgi:Protein of unknown function (DUF3558)
MTLTRLIGLAGLTLLLSVSGCAIPQRPAPTTGPPPAPQPTESAAPTSSPFPPRPAELRLNGVDPCQLLTNTQKNTLNVEQNSSGKNDDQLGSLDCAWTTPVTASRNPRPSNSWAAFAVLNQSADYALGNQAPVQTVQLDGYSAVETSSPTVGPDSECLLFIDVAQGENLTVRYDNFEDNYPGMNHQLACQLARKAAALMMQTLPTLAH